MAAAITATTIAEPFLPMTVSGTGFAAATAYVVKMTDPQGWNGYKNVTTDGSGAFSYTIVPQDVGAFVFDARPLTEMMGPTTISRYVLIAIPTLRVSHL